MTNEGFASLEYENIYYDRFKAGNDLLEFLEKNPAGKRLVDRAIADAQEAFAEFLALVPGQPTFNVKCEELHRRVSHPYHLLRMIDEALQAAAHAEQMLAANEDAKRQTYQD